MPDVQNPNVPPKEGSLPWLTGSALELVDVQEEPKVDADYITGAHVPDDDPEVVWPPRRTARLPWLLIALMVAFATWFAVELGVPAYERIDGLEKRVAAVEGDLAESRGKNHDLKQELKAATLLVEDLGRVNATLNAEEVKRKAAVEKLSVVETALATQLADRVKRGDVALAIDADQLVVTLADAALFADPVGLSDSGKGLLGEVGAAVRELGGVTIGAHYEAWTPTSVRSQYATPWSLSAARAASVAQFLQDGARIDAKRLTTLAYGSTHASASRTRAARATNRRVELRVGAPKPE